MRTSPWPKGGIDHKRGESPYPSIRQAAQLVKKTIETRKKERALRDFTEAKNQSPERQKIQKNQR